MGSAVSAMFLLAGMIMAEADEVSYTSMFNLNNLLIRIGKAADK